MGVTFGSQVDVDAAAEMMKIAYDIQKQQYILYICCYS
jgi:hypothetical protein